MFKIQKLQYNFKTKSDIVKDKFGYILFDNKKVADRWKEYIQEVYIGDAILEDNASNNWTIHWK